MSLNQAQRDTTAQEFSAAITKLQLTKVEVASSLHLSEKKLDDILQMRHQETTPENVWILRNYFLQKAEADYIPLEFTVLKADYHTLWFLNSRQIDQQIIQ